MNPKLTEQLQTFIDEHLVDRKDTNSVKWDALADRFGDDSLLPLWVADTEFKVPLAVREALKQQIDFGVFGYSLVPEGYYEAFFNWQKKRHHVTMKEDWLRFDTGVVNSIYAIVQWLTQPKDEVMITKPVYYPFINAIEDNNRTTVSADLELTESGWQMDFDKIETTFKNHDIKLMILCSPHNPVGRIWTEAELTQLFELCHQYHVKVIADEIHQDFEFNNHQFVSALSVANGKYHDDLIVLNAPSKTFNMATLLNSHIIIPNPQLRESFDEFRKSRHQSANSILGQVATMAAYRHGEQWLDNLLGVIDYNYHQLKDGLTSEFGEIMVSHLEGTYLSYVNLGKLISASEMQDFVQNKCRLAVDYGEWFLNRPSTFIRINLATDPAIVKEAVNRIVTQLKLIN